MTIVLAIAMLGLTGSTALGAERPSISRMAAKSQIRTARACVDSERVDPVSLHKWMRCMEEFNRVDGCYNGPPLANGYGYCDVHMEFLISRFPNDPNSYIWRCTTVMQYRQVSGNLHSFKVKSWFCAKDVS